MTNEQFDRFLETAFKRRAKTEQADEAAAARVLKRLAGPLPRQKKALWRLPGVLLDWQFTPAWPRVAALACCAGIGFAIGIVGLDRPFDKLDASFSVASRDFSAIVSEAEPLTGARP